MVSSADLKIIPIFDRGDYDHQIERGAGALQSGGLVVLPTETVYGVAGALTHPGARAGRRPTNLSHPTWPGAKMRSNTSRRSMIFPGA